MKLFKILLIFLILLQTTITFANEKLDKNLDKAFKKFSKDINKLIKKSEKLKAPEKLEISRYFLIRCLLMAWKKRK